MEKYLHKIKKMNNGCWEWQAHLNKGGYGTQTIGSRKDGSRKSTLAHRVFYALAFGQFNQKLCVLHSCDNTKCVNPEHLFLGSRADNHADMLAKGRRVNHKGERNGRSKLTVKDVHDIRGLLTNKVLQKDIANKYGVNQTLISHIKLGRIWSE